MQETFIGHTPQYFSEFVPKILQLSNVEIWAEHRISKLSNVTNQMISKCLTHLFHAFVGVCNLERKIEESSFGEKIMFIKWNV